MVGVLIARCQVSIIPIIVQQETPSLATNYPKGHGELFAEWMKENYPGELLFHVESTHGSHQDIMFTAALAIAMKRSFNIDFLDYCLRMSDKTKKDHVLQRSLFVVLLSVKMAAKARLLAIMFLIHHTALAMVGWEYP